MEAAGVEPASEGTPSQASTCVAALESSRPSSKSDGNRRSLAPKSLVAAREIRSNQIIEVADLTARRPGSGLSPAQITDVVGRRARATIPAGTLIRLDMLV